LTLIKYFCKYKQGVTKINIPSFPWTGIDWVQKSYSIYFRKYIYQSDFVTALIVGKSGYYVLMKSV
jgi:hypothetical protein